MSVSGCKLRLRKASKDVFDVYAKDDSSVIGKLAAARIAKGESAESAWIAATEHALKNLRKERRDIVKFVAEAYAKTGAGEAANAELSTADQSGDAAEKVSQDTTKAKIEDLGEKIGGARKDTAQPIGSRAKSTAEASEEAEPGWRKRFAAVKNLMAGETEEWNLFDARTNKPIRQGYTIAKFPSEEAADQAIPLIAVAQKHRVVSANRSNEPASYEIWRDVTDRKRVRVVDQAFPTRDDAMRYMTEHAVEIIETKTSFGEEILAKPEKVMRSGEARRAGPVRGDDFMQTFGFRAVEFGNWNNQDERQEVMNHAYDGLLDLAEVLGLPPKALSLNGDLSLAFGARGQGLSGARAHYERSYAVMNLTKMQGAGALAHEWFHAADHYFGRQDGKAKSGKITNSRGDAVFDTNGPSGDYASHGFQWSKSGVREELRKAYETLIKAMFRKAETYVDDTQAAEKFVGGARDALSNGLDKLRADLAAQKDPTYYKTKNKPASAEQLAEFDRMAARLVEGEDLATEYRATHPDKSVRSRGAFAGRLTNDTLEAMSVIYKAVRGRSGFNAERSGVLDQLRGIMARYAERIKMLNDARGETEKTKQVPTSYAMNAKRIDQGRASDYWTTEHEMAARAFSAYVEDKIAARDHRSDFLSFGSDNNMPEYRMFNVRPFPEGDERVAINQAFDNFFAEVKTKESDDGNVAMFSRGKNGAGQTAAAVRAEVAAQIGRSKLEQLERGGLVRIHDDMSTMSEAAQRYPDLWGRFDGQTIHLVASNLSEGQAAGVFQHEAWHALLRSLKFDQSPLYQKIMDRLAKLEQNNAQLSPWFKKAAAMIPKEDRGNDARRLNELAAYAIQQYESDMKALPMTLRTFVQDLVAAVRAFFMESLGWVPQNLTAADLAALTRRYVKAMATGEPAAGVMGEALASRDGDQKAAAFEDPMQLAQREHEERADQYRLTAAQREAFRPKVPADKVTGFFRAEEHEPAILRAKEYAEANNIQAFYVEADVSNLGGINDHFGNNHGKANPVFRAMTDIFREELERVGAKVVPVRHGGDEVSAVLMGSSDAAIRSAFARIESRIQAYANEQGLSQIKHPKGKKPGIGLYLGHSPINGEKIGTIVGEASEAIDAQKTAYQESQNVGRTQAAVSEGVPGREDARGEGSGRAQPHAAVPRLDSAGRNGDGEEHFARPNKAGLSGSNNKPPKWLDQLPPEVQEAARKAGVWAPSVPLKQRLMDLRDTAVKRLQQGLVDQFAPLKELDERAYVLARLTKSADAPLESLLLYGKPFMNDAGAVDVKLDKGGLIGVLQQLQGEHDRFFAWIAGNRAAQLKAAGKENLFTDTDITALKDLAKGKMPDGKDRATLYRLAHSQFNGYSKSVLDIAEKAGIINGPDRSIWESDWYVPFYRVMEDEAFSGPKNVSGLVNQYAFKKLKGGTNELADLMQNTLRNWSHLLSASLKNQAAAAALKTAEAAGVAVQVGDKQKGAVTVLEQGKPKHFMIDDPFVLDAITSLEWAGWNNPAMKWMQKAKHYLTLGVTISPTFKVRNLIRDQLAAIGQNPISYNVFQNLAQGWQGTSKESAQYAKMLTGGGLMRFGTFLEDDRAEHMKRLINQGVDPKTILDRSNKVKAALETAWDWWQDVGDRSENITRAAIYRQRFDQLVKDGKTEDEAHLMASFAARDSMDFSLQGQWGAIRFLTQLVPFLNARLQGLYKLGREGVAPSVRLIAGKANATDKQKAMRFGAVTGAVAMASIGLLLAYRDDDDWKQREEFDRDAYWWFKINGTAYRIPKPFEIGAIGTLAERGIEMAMDGMDKEARERFAGRVGAMLTQTFAMNPTPQLIKPLIDLYANKDSFTGRDIETMGMERLSKAERIGPRTSGVAQLAGKATSKVGLSPVQVDHLVNAYFAWLGTHLVMTVDFAVRPMMGLPDQPARKWPDDYFVLGDFAKDTPQNGSRYLSKFYEQAKEVQEAMADIRYYQSLGQAEKARELALKNKDKMQLAQTYSQAERQISDINKRIRYVQFSKLSAEAKRDQMDRLSAAKNRIAKLTEERREALQQRSR